MSGSGGTVVIRKSVKAVMAQQGKGRRRGGGNAALTSGPVRGETQPDSRRLGILTPCRLHC